VLWRVYFLKVSSYKKFVMFWVLMHKYFFGRLNFSRSKQLIKSPIFSVDLNSKVWKRLEIFLIKSPRCKMANWSIDRNLWSTNFDLLVKIVLICWNSTFRSPLEKTHSYRYYFNRSVVSFTWHAILCG
jgi:hypothetical protein